jgi:hypothetical protein
MAINGRTKSAATINKEVRRQLNHYAGQLTEKILAKALSGDSTAQLAACNLLLAANKPSPDK